MGAGGPGKASRRRGAARPGPCCGPGRTRGPGHRARGGLLLGGRARRTLDDDKQEGARRRKRPGPALLRKLAFSFRGGGRPAAGSGPGPLAPPPPAEAPPTPPWSRPHSLRGPAHPAPTPPRPRPGPAHPPRPRPRPAGHAQWAGPGRQVCVAARSCRRRLSPATPRPFPRVAAAELRAEGGLRGGGGRAARTAGAPGAAEGRAGEADVAGRPGGWPHAEGGAGRARPAEKPRAGRAFPGLLSELSPLPVGRASPAAPAPGPGPAPAALAPGRCFSGLRREEPAAGGAEFRVRGAARGAGERETRCPPGPRPPR